MLRTTVHASCPHGGLDYYDVSFTPAEFITLEKFQLACDEVRGTAKYQEDLTKLLAGYLPAGNLKTVGRHGSNTDITCEATCCDG